jgi:hypothetical protein
MNETTRIFNCSTDHNRFIERNGIHVKETAAVSSYIAQCQAKRHCLGKLVEFVNSKADMGSMPHRVKLQVEELKLTIEGKCMKVSDIGKIQKLIVSDWMELIKRLGVVSDVKRLDRNIQKVKEARV